MTACVRLILLLTFSSLALYGADDFIYPARMKAELAYKGFSVKRPVDNSWYIDPKNDSGIDLIFHHAPDSKTQTVFCRATLMALSGNVSTAAELEATIREGFSRPSTRNAITKIETKRTERQGQPAIEYYVEYEDHGAISEGVPLLGAYIRGVAILHPTFSGTYVDASYSERGLPTEIAEQKYFGQGQEFLKNASVYDASGKRTKAK